MSDITSPDKTDASSDEEAVDVAIDEPVPETKHLVRSGEDLSFNFVAYDEKITVLGASGSGKSYLANAIMKSLNGVSVWVYDFNAQFSSSRALMFHDLDEMLKVYDDAKRGHYILQPFDNSDETFTKFCAEAFKRGNLVLILDEVHNFCTKQSMQKEYRKLILSGRPRGISVISISSRPSSLPNHVLSNSKHVFSFRLHLESDLRYLASYMGDDVWILQPPDKRLKHKDEPALEPYTFYYRDMDTDVGQIGKV